MYKLYQNFKKKNVKTLSREKQCHIRQRDYYFRFKKNDTWLNISFPTFNIIALLNLKKIRIT